MPPSPPADLKAHLADLFATAVEIVAPEARGCAISLDRPKNPAHGDYACNLAMHLAKQLKRNPRELAAALIDQMPVSDLVERAEIAGAGFINLFLRPGAKRAVVHQVLASEAYGRGRHGEGKKVLVEFVSANPTGPLHVGHGRGAAYGASLANVLQAAGFDVHREYYTNDAGRQMDILATSVWLRYLDLGGEHVPFPPNAYQGDYVKAMAAQVFSGHGRKFVRPAAEVMSGVPPLPAAERDDKEAADAREAHLDALIAAAKRLLPDDYVFVHRFALNEQLVDCRDDLTEFGVTFDHWFSEQSLFDTGMVERTVEALRAGGHVYEQDGALWFRSTAFGDEKDRVVRRENGQYTYFAPDIAYHHNKFERGFDIAIDVWGADHHGYVPRVKGALQALGIDPERLKVALVQFAVLYRAGKKVSMSTRAGQYVTLRELRSEVGNDAARFFYVLRKSDQHLDFDLDLAKSQSTDNPVYYIQYAHARVSSVLEQWGGDPAALLTADLEPLVSPQEMQLLQRLIDYPEAIEGAARDLAPHLVAFYLRDLAGDFHSYYNATRLLVDEEPLKLARLALAAAVQRVLKSGLILLGVGAPDKM
jgi:arginyl-tRNA synthetase